MEDPIRAGLENAVKTLTDGHFKHCTTGFGQKYVLFGMAVGSLFELWMITANARNVEAISRPMKISINPMGEEAILSLINICQHHWDANPLPDFTCPPPACTIPTSAQLIAFSAIDLEADPSGNNLLPGDEVFVACCLPNGQIWNHAGIHLGGGWFCYFTPINGFNFEDFLAGKAVSGSVTVSSSMGFMNAVASVARRRCFRVTHPLLVREGLAIVEKARQLMDQKTFTKYDYKMQNSQHFTSICAYGVPFSFDTEKLYGIKNPSVYSKVARLEPTTKQPIGHLSKDTEPEVAREMMKTKFVMESQYVGGPFVEKQAHNPNLVSHYVASFDMPDSEYFAL